MTLSYGRDVCPCGDGCQTCHEIHPELMQGWQATLVVIEEAYPTAKEFKYTKKLRGKPALMEWKYRCCERCARRFDRSREHHKPDRYKSKRKGR